MNGDIQIRNLSSDLKNFSSGRMVSENKLSPKFKSISKKFSAE